MSPQDALSILSQATEPANVVRLTRTDYVHIQEALQTLNKAITPAAPKAPEEPKQSG